MNCFKGRAVSRAHNKYFQRQSFSKFTDSAKLVENNLHLLCKLYTEMNVFDMSNTALSRFERRWPYWAADHPLLWRLHEMRCETSIHSFNFFYQAVEKYVNIRVRWLLFRESVVLHKWGLVKYKNLA